MKESLELGHAHVKTEEIKAVLEMIIELLDHDLCPADRWKQDDKIVFAACLYERVRNIYYPALSHIFGSLCGLQELLEEAEKEELHAEGISDRR